jgi:hypothetical protein
MKNQDSIIKKENNFNTFDNLHKTASVLAQDIANFLGEEIEELNVFSHLFKSGLERNLLRVLSSLYKQPQSIVIFPDSIPGFTVMVFKKTAPETQEFLNDVKISRNPTEEIKESQALDSVINNFFTKNKQKIMLIENEDILFALFPVADTRKNLKEMELYITF